MNKNTIIKLIAVLAMCFLIGGALVACKGAAGPAGPQGPQGEKGETGAAGSTPELTIGANGNWFADGVDLGVKAPSADAACAEHDFAYVDVVKHTQTEDGIVVKACKTCGFAAITNETLHVMVEDEVPANCLEAKWVGEICSVCGEKGKGEFVGEPNGHDYARVQPVYEVNKPVCQYGGLLVKHCVDCNDVKYEPVTAEDFDCVVVNWSKDIIVPTETQLGTAFGSCKYCSEPIKYDLPLIDSGKYDIKTIKATTCALAGEYEYTYVDESANLEVKFTTRPEATGHKLNGQNYALYDIDNVADTITVPYWYGTPDADGRLSALNVKPFAGVTFKCPDATNTGVYGGYFFCEECNDVVDVNVKYGHNGVATEITAASCIKEGTKKVDCDYCDFNGEAKIDKLPHVYIYNFDKNGTGTVNSESVQLYKLHGECAGNGCTDAECTATDVIAEDIYKYEEVALKAANCLEYGQIKYTYNVASNARTYTKVVLTPKTKHILNGEQVLDTVVLTSATKGIKLFAGDSFGNYACETPGIKGYFVCEYCATVEGVEPIVPVFVKKVHTEVDVELDPDNPADCVNTGKYIFNCSDPMCATKGADGEVGKKLSGTAPALGHDVYYDWEKGTDADDKDIWTVYELCNRCDAYKKEIAVSYKLPEVVAEVKATCYSDGYTKYSILVNNKYETITKEVSKDTVGHTLNGKEVKKDATVLPSTTNGVKLFAGNTLVCLQSVAGYYECEACKAAGLDAIVEIDVYKDHDYSDIRTAPGCTTIGKAYCADCKKTVDVPATGHGYTYSYDVDDNLVLTITGECGNCTPETVGQFKEWTLNLPAINELNVEKYYGKPVVVEKATCTEGIVEKYTLSVKLVDADTIAAIELEEKKDMDAEDIFYTVEFEYEGASKGHVWMRDNYNPNNSTILTIEREEIVDEKTEETEIFYYVVIVCDDCGEYLSNRFDAEDYEKFLEKLESLNA